MTRPVCPFPQRRVCLIGCAGFIGSHLLERLLSREGVAVCGVDRDDRRITGRLGHPRFTFVKADIADPRVVLPLIDQCDVVINLAALCNPSLYNTVPVDVIESNYAHPLEIVRACARRNKWLIHFSTCEVYGKTLSQTVAEEHDRGRVRSGGEFSEDRTPLILGPVTAQRWSYAAAKQLLERTIYAYGFQHGLKFTIVRPFNFIGPRMDFIPGVDGDGVPRVVACFMNSLMKNRPLQLVNGGKNRRTFTWIADAVDAVVAMLEKPSRAQGEIFNIGHPRNEISIAGLADLMAQVYRQTTGAAAPAASVMQDVPAEVFYGRGYEDTEYRVPDISKARALLKWEPQTGLTDAVTMTVRGFYQEYKASLDLKEAS